MIQFTRAWRGFERLFPGARAFSGPQQFDETIRLVADILKPSLVVSGVRLVEDQQTGAGAGADLVLTAHPEPAAGFIHLPVLLAVALSGAVRQVDVQILVGTGTLDPWGRTAGGTRIFGSVQVGNDRVVSMPLLPVTRTTQLQTIFRSAGLGQNATATYFAVEVPGELVSLELLARPLQNMVNTAAV